MDLVFFFPAAGLIAGCFFSRMFLTGIFETILYIAALGLPLILLSLRQKKLLFVFLFILFFLAGALNARLFGSRNASLPEFSGDIKCTVLSVNNSQPDTFRHVVAMKERGLLAVLYGKQVYLPGDSLSVRGSAAPLKSGRNPHSGGQAYFKARNIHYRIYPEKIVKAGEEKSPLLFLTRKTAIYRMGILKKIREGMPAAEAALFSGVMLGEKAFLPDKVEERIRDSGIMHILSVSGLHTGLFVYSFMLFLSSAGIGKKKSVWIMLPFLFFFGFLTSWTQPVTRAVIMTLLVFLSILSDRKLNLLNSLFLTFLIVMLFNPFSVYDASFQLSFISVAGIGLFYEYFRDKIFFFLPEALRGPLAVTFSAQLPLTPLLALYFQKYSFISPLTNLIAIPYSFATVALGIIYMFAAPVPFISGVISDAVYLCQALFLYILRLVDLLDKKIIETATPQALYLIIFFSILLIAYYLKDRLSRINFLYTLVPAVILIALLSFGPKGTGEGIYFLDVGQADASVIITGGARVLIDGGYSYGGYSAGRTVILPFLKGEGVNKLDLVVLSHPHADHLGGLPEVLEALEVKEVWINGDVSQSDLYMRFLKIIEKRNIKLTKVSSGHTLSFGGLSLETLHPSPGFKAKNMNDNSLVIKVRLVGGPSVLYAGDIESPAVAALIDSKKNIKADILKVPHHGARADNFSRFLRKVSPEISVISVGDKRKFNHPDPATVAELKRSGTKIFSTFDVGCIIITPGKQIYKVTDYSGAPLYSLNPAALR